MSWLVKLPVVPMAVVLAVLGVNMAPNSIAEPAVVPGMPASGAISTAAHRNHWMLPLSGVLAQATQLQRLIGPVLGCGGG